MKRIDIETLAVMFRVLDPNLGHVSTHEKMEEIGLAYSYGYFRGIPKHHWRKRRQMAENIAAQLDRKAKEFSR